MKLYLYNYCAILFLITSAQLELPAQANYQGKYKSQMETGSKILEENYTTTLEQIDTNNFIRKYFYPETKQITHFISYNSKNQIVKHGTYREWLDDGTLYVNGMYKNDVRTGLWLLEGQTGYFANGLKDGLWERYDNDNILKSTENYSEGKLNGWTFLYDSLGIKTDSVMYKKGIQMNRNSRHSKKAGKQKTIEITPEFKNGQGAFYSYLNSHITYPADAKKYGIKGKAIVEFTIDTNGEVVDITVIRGLCDSIKKVCQDIFENMPDWTPGTQNGIPVRVKYTLPLTFKLE